MDFSVNVRVGGSDRYRFVEARLPKEIRVVAPITIRSEIRPTGGSVKIAISPKIDRELFGQNAEIALRWDRAEERDIRELDTKVDQDQIYGYPYIFQSEGEIEKRRELSAVAEAVAGGQSLEDFLDVLDRILVPSLSSRYREGNDYIVPFGNRPITHGLDPKLDGLVAAINEHAIWHIQNVDGYEYNAWKWVRIAASLFYYASLLGFRAGM
jgi:hypothetical protein